MKTLTFINWGLVIFYLGLFAFSLYDYWTVGTDKAGQGLAFMGMLFMAIGVAVLFVLNLLPHQWAKLLTLVLGLAPILYTVNNSANRYFRKANRASPSYHFKNQSHARRDAGYQG